MEVKPTATPALNRAGIAVIFKLFSGDGLEHRDGSGLLSPWPFVMQTTGPSVIIFRGKVSPWRCKFSKQDCCGASTKGLGQAPGAVMG